MTDPAINVAITVGAKASATIDHVIAPNLVVLRISHSDGSMLIPVRLASVTAIPGYEREFARSLEQSLHDGDTVEATWLGVDQVGTAQAAISYINRQGMARPVESHSLESGLCLVSPEAQAVPGTRFFLSGYQSEGARTLSGAWGDHQMRPVLVNYSIKQLGFKQSEVSPGFVYANPGLAVLMLLVVGVGLTLIVRRDTNAFRDKLGARDVGFLKRMFLWSAHLHVRYLRPIPRRESVAPVGDKPEASKDSNDPA